MDGPAEDQEAGDGGRNDEGEEEDDGVKDGLVVPAEPLLGIGHEPGHARHISHCPRARQQTLPNKF